MGVLDPNDKEAIQKAIHQYESYNASQGVDTLVGLAYKYSMKDTEAYDFTAKLLRGLKISPSQREELDRILFTGTGEQNADK